MICQFMGSAEDAVVNSVTNSFGGQTGQLAQSGVQQFGANPGQFIQQIPNNFRPGSPLTQD